MYWVGYFILKFLSLCFFPYKVYGGKNLPQKGNYILASNHASNLDPVLIGLCKFRIINYFAKDTLFKSKVFGQMIRWGHAFPVKRGTADRQALKEAIRRLKHVGPLVMFPQGTRKTEQGLWQDKAFPGIGFLAVRADVPIVPVYVWGSDKVLPRGAKWFKRHPIHIWFGAPMHFKRNEDYNHIAEKVMESIRDLHQKAQP